MHAPVLGGAVRATLAAGSAPLAPRLLGAAVVLALGWGVSLLLERGLAAFLDAVGFEDLVRRSQVAPLAERSRLRSGAGRLVTAAAVWLLRAVTLLIALELLGWSPLPGLVTRLRGWLPGLAAVLVVLLLVGLAVGVRYRVRGGQGERLWRVHDPSGSSPFGLGIAPDSLLAGADGRAIRSGYDRRRLAREGPDRRSAPDTLPG